MTDALLDAVRRYADAHAETGSQHMTPIRGFTVIRETVPNMIRHSIMQPLVCLVLQGRKQVNMGAQSFEFGAGDSLLITADIPTVSQITKASVDTPYLSLAVDLDPGMIADLRLQMGSQGETEAGPVRIVPTRDEVADAAHRIMKLLDRPEAVPVLHEQLLRELHYWLLMGRHGSAIRRLGWAEGHEARIARAVAVIRARYDETLPVDGLADVAGMSPSSFHSHFKAITSLSPLQFQKQLRLIEARRLMLAEGSSASHAAYAVGYESVPQFTREYARMFGLPPARDKAAAQERAETAA
jgi:AraC-like DNA-binding protein